MSLAFERAPLPFPARALAAGLVVSLALHGAALALITREDGGGPEVSAGDGGQELETLAAIEAQFIELAPPAITLPAPEMTLPLSAPKIDIPQVALPDPILLPPEIRPDPPAPKTRPQPKPEPKAARREPAPTPSESRAATRASGAGGAELAGAAGQAALPALSPGQTQNLLNRWGAQIRSRIERSKRYPASAGRASGTAIVNLTVSQTGQLLAATVARSSGHGALDNAALAAVRKAGRFSAAPKGLNTPSHTFALALQFRR
ncbi:protein TonB [Rhodobacter sp. JA431]|uniref:energy transducer TonB family protein n=1 Tax=Rhodobacter sp. JA431 TaxID=570013 RepID=UPI000BCD7FDF|nr:TonB family protein [Rhodobacter sp. JA431]SOC09824.1 protein TonB [Rhodobacter sp. JA431]